MNPQDDVIIPEAPKGEPETPKFSRENPLVLNRIQKNNETGGIDLVLALSMEQTYVLLQFAIMFLMSQGLAMFAPPTEPEKEEESPTIELDKQLH